jgi:hypothetical protein
MVLRSELIVGVYDETTKSETHSVPVVRYIPAACIGRKANGPVGHHHNLTGESDFCGKL